MTRSIYKYEVGGAYPEDMRALMLAGPIVHVEPYKPSTGRYGATLWVDVDDNGSAMTRKFVIHGTGHPIYSPLERHLHTWFDGAFVRHLFENYEDDYEAVP